MIIQRGALLLLLASLTSIESFTISANPTRNLLALHAAAKTAKKSARGRSRVSDPTGPTPRPEDNEPEVISVDDIPELKYDPSAHPIPHQPWRRGVTDGCEAPIDADWRVEAEETIRKAVNLVGGSVKDCTWYLTSLVVTIDEDDLIGFPRDLMKTHGPVINVRDREGPVWRDPEDPEPADIWADDVLNNPVYERDIQGELEQKRQAYATKEEGEDDSELLYQENEVSHYVDQETRADSVVSVMEQFELEAAQGPHDVPRASFTVNKQAVSTIAAAILDSLEIVEERLQILARHELVLAALGPPGYLETQSQFDAHRDEPVVIETSDPWDSNRTLKGRLVDRNSMDIIINQQGRMVTIPLNFVACVRVAIPRPTGDDADAVAEADDEYEYEDE